MSGGSAADVMGRDRSPSGPSKSAGKSATLRWAGVGPGLGGPSLNLDRSRHFRLRLVTSGECQERRFQCPGCL